jgi:alkanesulfonate monooxygenase SsuD/methylene tetrahydromethanopterin reductase-like flavin-dependent oxidoreductase (luciferase family)
MYAERCAAAGKPHNLDRSPFFRFVHLAEDEKEAREYPRDALTWCRDIGGYRRTITRGDEINWDLDHWRRTRTVTPASFESEAETTTYFVTPDQCVQRIKNLQTNHRVGYFGASMSFGSMGHAEVMRSMELFGKEVMPKFR